MATRDLTPLYRELMPAFHRWPNETSSISRIIAAFGELEFILTLCVGEVLGDRDTGLRTIFRLGSDRARIETADALIRNVYKTHGLEPQYAETIATIRHCRNIRNQYAHCHYGDHVTAGLFLTNLQDAADKSESFDYLWRHVDLPLLAKQEAYFFYAIRCLQFLEGEIRVKLGRTGVPSFFPWPTKLEPPPKHNPPSQHIPPWLSEDQQRQHLERALEQEQGGRLPKAKQPRKPKPSARERRDAALK
jgi:hypothetical protein